MSSFGIYDPLKELANDVAKLANSGGSGVPEPGSITGAQIAANTITSFNLASGAAAANINSGPIGSINESQIAGSPFLPLSGGTMSGPIQEPLAPVNPNDLVNKAYVDSIATGGTPTPDATTTTTGKVQLAGDLGGTGTTAIAPIISNHAINNAKLANMSGPSQLKGSSSSSSTTIDITLGSNLSIDGSTLNATYPPQPLPQNAGNAQFGVVEFDPSGDLTQTAINSGIANVKPLAINNAKLANMSGFSQLKGSSSSSSTTIDITLGSNLSMNGTTLDINTSSLSSTFLPLSGGTMSGAIQEPLAPVNPNDLVNKAYVDSIVSSSSSNATTTTTGKVQLAGDLGGTGTTATAPIISNLAINNAKLANMSGPSQLKGSSATASTTIDINLGSGLLMNGTDGHTLDVNTGNLQKAGNLQFGVTKFDPSGDLIQTATNSGIANVKSLAINNAKLANMSGPSQLKGSSSSSSTTIDITLGSGLTMNGTTLDVTSVQPLVQNAGNAQFGVIEFDPSGDLTQTATNSGIAFLKQPAPGTVATNVGFDSSGRFVSNSGKLGKIYTSGLLSDSDEFTVENLVLRVPFNPPWSLQARFVSGSGYIAGSAQPYWNEGAPPASPTPFVTGRYIYRFVTSTTFVYLSERVENQPSGNTSTAPPFDTSTAPETSGFGYIEIYNVYVAGVVDGGVFRITVNHVNIPIIDGSSKNSYITVERLSFQP